MSNPLNGILGSSGGGSGGSGDVVGPASSTDNAIARFDGATGKLLQNSDLLISEPGIVANYTSVLQFGGSTSSFPGFSRVSTSGTEIRVVLADLSAFTTLRAGTLNVSASGTGNTWSENLLNVGTAGTWGTSGLYVPLAAVLNWSATPSGGGGDTGLARSAAGQIKVTDGSTGYGKLLVRNDGGSSLVGIAFGGTTNSQPALAANGDELWVVGAADPYGQFNTLRAATLKASIFQQVNDGIYGDSGGLTIASGNGFLFSNGATAPGTPDVGLKRSAAGVAIISGGTSGIGKLLNAVLVEANTAGSGTPNAIAATESGTVFTNEGATAKNYEALPTAAAGYQYTFIVQDADGMRIVANTDDTIRVIDKVTAAAGYIESTTIGSTVTLVSINAVEWYATSINGVWTDGTFTYDDTSLTTP